MSTNLKVALGAVLVLGLVLACWWIVADIPEYRGQKNFEMPEISRTVNTAISDEIPASEQTEEQQVENQTAKVSDRAAVDPLDRMLTGKVIDLNSGLYVRLFQFNLRFVDEKGVITTCFNETIKNEKGEFSFPLEQAGKYRLAIQSPNHLRESVRFDVDEDCVRRELEIKLDPGFHAKGRVVDDATGEAVIGAVVRAVPYMGYDHNLYQISRGEEACCVYAKTDRNGLFALSGLDKGRPYPLDMRGKWVLAATHPDYAQGTVVADVNGEEEVKIRLERGHTIFGSVLDDHGRPAPGVMISISGDSVPSARSVLTDQEGIYRTQQVLPGPIFLHAGPPPSGLGPVDFTEERKSIVMKDRDVEVNFGPSPDFVTWRGTFFGVYGEPVPGGKLSLHPIQVDLTDSYRHNQQYKTQCDDQGRFELKKFLPGTYELTVGWTSSLNWGKITFERPGIVHRDIEISGGRIEGVVIDGSTGMPFQHITARDRVTASIWKPDFKYFRSAIDVQGRFMLAGLPAGGYFVQVQVEGYPIKVLDNVELKKGEILKDLRIEINTGGTLLLRLEGFTDVNDPSFEYSITRPDQPNYYVPPEIVDRQGQWEIKRVLEIGEWNITVTFEELGLVTRTCAIFEGRTTEVVIHPSEMAIFEGFCSVSGSLIRPDGTPVPGTTLHFYGREVPGLKENKRSISATTDKKGRFTQEGFKPGRWSLRGTLEKGDQTDFPEFMIPPVPTDPFPLNLVLPDGVVTGILSDAMTRQDFIEEGPLWWTFLSDVESGEMVCQLQGGHTGPDFRMVGIPEGKFQLTISVRGYTTRKLSPFSLAKGQAVDLGRIGLDPCGVLDLEVVDERGGPIEKFQIYCDGKKVEFWRYKSLGKGKCHCFDLPLGTICLRVTAQGYFSKETSVTLEPGRPETLRVTLTEPND